MNEKIQLTLNELIEVYLVKSEPLSSSKLKEIANLPFSASSIRSYLKKLEEYELIEKEHFSSGSYPSIKAMRSFWLEYFKSSVLKEDFENYSDELDIYIMIEMFENQLLKNVYNLDNKFTILEFEKDEVIFKYKDELYTLFKSLKGILLDELKKYLLHIGLKKEYEKLKSLYKYCSLNKKFLYTQNLETKDFENYNFNAFEDGLSFVDKYLIFKTFQKENKLFKQVLIIGNIYSDYTKILKRRGVYEQKKA